MSLLSAKDSHKRLAILISTEQIDVAQCKQGFLEFDKNRFYCVLVGSGLFFWSKELDDRQMANDVERLKKNLEGCFDLQQFLYIHLLRVTDNPFGDEKKKTTRLRQLISERSSGRDESVSFLLAFASRTEAFICQSPIECQRWTKAISMAADATLGSTLQQAKLSSFSFNFVNFDFVLLVIWEILLLQYFKY